MESLTRLPDTPTDFEPARKVEKWLKKLNAMRAVDEIGEDDSRQLWLDLYVSKVPTELVTQTRCANTRLSFHRDSAYAQFTRYLKK
jgi:VPS28 protein